MDKQFFMERLLPVEYQESSQAQLLSEQSRIEELFKANKRKLRKNYLQAGVLIPLVKTPQDKHWHVILTRRAEHLKHHPGEISFPGGRFENQDKSLAQTAIRETYEEIGLQSGLIEIVGKLPTQATISQYHVTPYVGMVEAQYSLEIDSNEVEEAFCVPLDFLIDKNNQQLLSRTVNGQTFSYYQIEYNHYKIWGATAQMLVRLSERLAR